MTFSQLYHDLQLVVVTAAKTKEPCLERVIFPVMDKVSDISQLC